MDGLCGDRRPAGAPWVIEEIPFQDVDRDLVRNDRHLFYSLAAASFVEITADLYTSDLVEFYRGDDEVSGWLSQQWEPEELRHGAALKHYVETAWPEFDWGAAYRSFFAEYSRCCGINRFAPTRELELASRCVVETGTATLYRALSNMTDEPVLKRIASLISADEVRHYKHFYRFFQRYHECERTSRFAIARILWQRMAEVDAEDGFVAFRHVFLASNPGTEFQLSDYTAFRASGRRLAKQHYPYSMAVRMMLKPLELSSPITRMIVPPIVSAAQFLLLR
jgi:hypothetical protein